MRCNLDFYRVDEKYAQYLREFDHTVTDTVEIRVFIGVLLTFDNVDYLAPLTSQGKHIKSSDPKVFKIHEYQNPNNQLGMVQLRNMIPVNSNYISLLDFEQLDPKYVNMLDKQLVFLRKNEDKIKKKAARLYKLVGQGKIKGCSNFELLKEKMLDKEKLQFK